MTEIEILIQHEPLLNAIVNRFIRRCSMPTTSREDLMQEARLAFLLHIRTHRPEEYGRCWLTIWHALCDAVRRDYFVSMPRAVFFNKDQRQHHAAYRDTLPMVLKNGANPYELSDLLAAVMAEAEKHQPEAVRLVELKREGYSNREAACMLGKSDTWASRTLKRMMERIF